MEVDLEILVEEGAITEEEKEQIEFLAEKKETHMAVGKEGLWVDIIDPEEDRATVVAVPQHNDEITVKSYDENEDSEVIGNHDGWQEAAVQMLSSC
jgi:hypothetical protein